MLIYKSLVFSCVVSFGTLTNTVVAEKAHDHSQQTVEQTSHVHGEANLFIVLEGEQLLVELEAPGMSLVGFEHQAHTDEQKRHLVKTQHLLERAGQVVSIDGGQCQYLPEAVEISGLGFENHDSHDSHDSHSEIHAKYTFLCTQPNDVQFIEVSLFKHFSDLTEVTAQWIIQSQQGAQRLTPDAPKIKLK